MRREVWILALCGLGALILGLGLTGGHDSDGKAKDGERLEIPPPPQGNTGDGSSAPPPPGELDQDASSNSSLIHAEYNRPQGASKDGEIRQLRAEGNRAGDASGEGSQGSGSQRKNTRTPMIRLQWVRKSDINVSKECECHLLVTNPGEVTARDVTVEAYFPSSVRLTAAEPRPIEQPDHLSWQWESLEPGDRKRIRITMIPSQPGEIATEAYVHFTGQAAGVFNVAEPMLKVALNGPTEMMVGDPASQMVVVTNPGTGTVENAVIEADVPQGLAYTEGDRVQMSIGSIQAGESRVVRLPLTASAGGAHTLNVTVRGSGDLQETASSTLNVVAPSLQVVLDGPEMRYVGRTAGYRLTVRNDGTAPSNNVRVTYQIPEGFRFVRGNQGISYDSVNRRASWFLGQLKPGESKQLELQLTAKELGEHVHRVKAVSEHGARAEAKLPTRVDGTASLILDIVDRDDPVEVGIETMYEIRVRNEGSKAGQNVKIVCEIPDGLELLSTKGPADFVAEDGRITFEPLQKLAPGKTALYRIRVRGRAGGNHRFRARLTSGSIGEPLTVEELTRFYGEPVR